MQESTSVKPIYFSQIKLFFFFILSHHLYKYWYQCSCVNFAASTLCTPLFKVFILFFPFLYQLNVAIPVPLRLFLVPRALLQADVVLLLGARLNWMLHFGLPPRFHPGVKIIQVCEQGSKEFV